MTPKQKAFCDFYLQSLNATEAAIKAGYSKKTAYKTGSENLIKPQIKNYITERLNKLDTDRIANVEEVLIDISNIARDKSLEIRDRLKAYELLLKRYPIEPIEQDNKLEIIIKKASEVASDEK